MMATTKPNQKIHIDKLKAASGELERLAEKPKEELSLRDSIYFLRDQLRLALKKGYSYQDLSELLEQQEILISAATLKQYLTEINKESDKGKRTTRSRQAKQPSPPATPDTAAVISEASETESEEKKAELEEPEQEISEQLDNRDGAEYQQKIGKATKRKPRGVSKASLELSSEFNQY